MATHWIPRGCHTVKPYLLIERVAEVLEFACQAFGAVEISRTQRATAEFFLLETPYLALQFGIFGVVVGTLYSRTERARAADGTHRGRS